MFEAVTEHIYFDRYTVNEMVFTIVMSHLIFKGIKFSITAALELSEGVFLMEVSLPH